METHGLKIVFTGPAYDAVGRPILRADLAHAVKQLGMIPQANFAADTQLLVASRDDTGKAAKASARGIKILTYPAFLDQFQVPVEAGKGGPRNTYVDTHTSSGPHPGLLGGNEL